MDPLTRYLHYDDDSASCPNHSYGPGPRPEQQLEVLGKTIVAELYQSAVKKLQQIGGEKIEIDFSVFRQAADLLYGGPWVAERLAAIKVFFREHAGEMEPVVRAIIGGAERYTAVDVFESHYRLRELRREAEKQWAGMEVLVLPTTGT